MELTQAVQPLDLGALFGLDIRYALPDYCGVKPSQNQEENKQ
jgi:hypothetical protein